MARVCPITIAGQLPNSGVDRPVGRDLPSTWAHKTRHRALSLVPSKVCVRAPMRLARDQPENLSETAMESFARTLNEGSVPRLHGNRRLPQAVACANTC
jgi:hypothetical protein